MRGASLPDAVYWVGLGLVPGLGGESYRQLLRAFGEPRAIYAAPVSLLSSVVKPSVAAAIAAQTGLEEASPTADWLAADPANALVTLADACYPSLLLEIPDPPPFLFAKGRLDMLARPALAVVGSRNPTSQGQRDAENFARCLSEAGLCISSGMALGIDAAAHRGALVGGGGTIAVVGTGLDRIYPARHEALARQIATEGLLLSEFPLGTPALPANFPRRNRIISGLALGCLVVEAAPRSGSLITARQASEQGREVFAIPGSIHSPLSRGCHQLIRQGAKLVESAQDVLEELRFSASHPASIDAPDQGPPGLSAEENALLLHLGHAPLSVDALAQRSGLTAERVSSILLTMELTGVVASMPGGLFQRLD